ncbi:peroxide stress protein YaaA [Polaromonas sp. P1(28)-8]|nr:peroxide stress protein YaaA [Polaromonas sp. P1(28)-8]
MLVNLILPDHVVSHLACQIAGLRHPPHVAAYTKPLFTRQSAELIDVLQTKTPQQISTLMKLSDALSGLNFALPGVVPQIHDQKLQTGRAGLQWRCLRGLDAKTLNEQQLGWAQDHVCILSGLYGVLRPLDWMQPYRLEMGTALATGQGRNLYQFWGSQIADYLNQRAAAHTSPVIVNLASEEYFKAVDRKALKPRVVSCVFEEFRAGKYKIISFMAKRPLGLMVRYATEHKLATVKKLEGFDAEGYRFDPAASEADRLVFRRRQAA